MGSLHDPYHTLLIGDGVYTHDICTRDILCKGSFKQCTTFNGAAGQNFTVYSAYWEYSCSSPPQGWVKHYKKDVSGNWVFTGKQCWMPGDWMGGQYCTTVFTHDGTFWEMKSTYGEGFAFYTERYWYVNLYTYNLYFNAKDTSNNNLKYVELFRAPVSNYSDFIIQRCPNLCSATFTDLTTELKNCTTSVQLMSNRYMNDVIIIGLEGIPNKLTFTISTPGVYSGTLHYQYWNGLDWVYFPETQVIDGTNGFRISGTHDVILPAVPDWKRKTIGATPLYWCRAIFDSIPTVTTAPQASCFRWSGDYILITDANGNASVTLISIPNVTLDIIGYLPGYICKTGCGTVVLREGDNYLNLVLFKSDLTCNVKCPTIVYIHETKNILVSSNVGFGGITNQLKITAPDSTITPLSGIASGTDIPVPFKFDKEGLYKIELSSIDDGRNTCSKTCYSNILVPTSCSVLTDQTSCEANGCYWVGGRCVSEYPITELTDIYQSIISNQVCISKDCISILDLNNDNSITSEDLALAQNLTPDVIFNKILTYNICKEVYPCKAGGGGPTPSEGTGIIIIGVGALALLYLLKRKK